MGIVVAITFALVVWIVTWALGLKSFDGFLIGAFIALIAVANGLITPYLPGNRPGPGNRPAE
jgi:hypothetical protein